MTENAGGPRRQARERALSLLYEAESKAVSPAEVLHGLPVEPAQFATDVVSGVSEHMDELDKWISEYARDWTIDRMPALDRALLRMGVFELLHRPDVPTGAVISEAVELAQRFSTDESSRFVNGMLARIAEAVRPGPSGPLSGMGPARPPSDAEAVDAEAVGADPAEDDEPPAGEVVEERLHQ
ncbi:MAG TPA: transcription antitermination factor NusB [Acidimicrobiales bacterium]|nr:transcription antitermination factor NusB [Acidimicrobiales bacterium]